MMRSAMLFVLALAGPGSVLQAQTTARIDSHGSAMVATVWQPAAAPSATVLLIPGWGGGPSDALGIGRALADAGMAVVVLSPRGWHDSEGTATFAHALEDIGAALAWVRVPANAGRYGLTPGSLVLGGYSWGGGMALAYAARDPSVKRVFSAAGTDHGQFIRQYRADSAFAAMVDELLASSAAPAGPIRFDVAFTMQELAEGQAVYGLIENAAKLADRSILLFGGWEDENVTVDHSLLPLYRALRAAGAGDVTFKVYHTDHSFGGVRADLHADLIRWIERSAVGPGSR
jgi:dienelactone hydrolase